MKRVYATERVVGFAAYLLKRALIRHGFSPAAFKAESGRLEAVVQTSDFGSVFGQIRQYASVSHTTRQGRLRKEEQDKLNLVLAHFDLVGAPPREKQAYIQRVIGAYEAGEAEKAAQKVKNEFIARLTGKIVDNHDRLAAFLMKMDRLYTVQRRQLRRNIRDDRFLTDAERQLEQIYAQAVQDAIEVVQSEDGSA